VCVCVCVCLAVRNVCLFLEEGVCLSVSSKTRRLISERGVVVAKGEATLLIRIKQKGKQILKGLTGNIKDINTATLKATLAVGVFAVAFTAAMFKLAVGASKAREVKTAFTNLVSQQGRDAEQMLKNMKELSVGTISDLELMKKANNALLLGLPIDRFGDMLNIARSSAKATGQSMEFMLNSIVTGLGRGSKLMLDNLGIVFDLNKANKEYAASLKKTTAQLTEGERKQAFINKALSIGLENTKKAGTGGLSLSDSWDQLKATTINLSVAIGDKLIPAFKLLIDPVNTAFAAMNNFFKDKTLSTRIVETGNKINFLRIKIANLKRAAAGKKTVGVEGGFIDRLEQRISNFAASRNPEAAAKVIRRLEGQMNQLKFNLEGLKLKKPKINKQEEEDSLLGTGETEAQRTARENQLIAEEEFFIRQAEQRALFRGTEAQVQEAVTRQEIEAEVFKQNKIIKNEKDFNKRQEAVGKKAAATSKLIELNKNKAILADRAATLNTFAALAGSSNSVLATIGKAAAITQIAIKTPQAVASALAWGTTLGGPALGATFAGIIKVAMAAQAAQVAGIQLAQGGIVTARTGGTSAVLGEAGKDEAVIPLDDERTQEKLGLGGHTFIFNGAMLGDEAQAREFAIEVDRELFALRQGGSSIAFDTEVQ